MRLHAMPFLCNVPLLKAIPKQSKSIQSRSISTLCSALQIHCSSGLCHACQSAHIHSTSKHLQATPTHFASLPRCAVARQIMAYPLQTSFIPSATRQSWCSDNQLHASPCPRLGYCHPTDKWNECRLNTPARHPQLFCLVPCIAE